MLGSTLYDVKNRKHKKGIKIIITKNIKKHTTSKLKEERIAIIFIIVDAAVCC